MNRRELRPRDLIIDAYGEKGIVYERQGGIPHPKWLARQKDPRMRNPSLVLWWSALPLSGGGACVPDGLAELVGEASVDDVATAAQAGGPTAVGILKRLFPECF